MKKVAAGAFALAVAASILTTLFIHAWTESAAAPPAGARGYSQGKYDPGKPRLGTTNVPANPYNNSVPIGPPQDNADEEWDD